MTSAPPNANRTSSTDIPSLLGPDLEAGIRINMVTTVTGSATMRGTTELLGNATDTNLFMALREWADVILVGAETVRAEDYGGAVATKQRPQPAPIAVVSGSLEFDLDSRFFHDYVTPPLFIAAIPATVDPAVTSRAAALRERGFEVIDIPGAAPTEVVEALNQRGFRKILSEGGPSMVGQFINEGQVHQFYLTVSPWLSARPELPLSACLGRAAHRKVELDNAAVDADGTVFLRYRSARTP